MLDGKKSSLLADSVIINEVEPEDKVRRCQQPADGVLLSQIKVSAPAEDKDKSLF